MSELLKPYAVPLKVALQLLGDKSRSQFYVEAARGEYELLKDGDKTLVVLESIERKIASLPAAKLSTGQGKCRGVGQPKKVDA